MGQKVIESTGEVVSILKVFKNAGKFEGNICTLVKVQHKTGQTSIIEAPLFAK